MVCCVKGGDCTLPCRSLSGIILDIYWDKMEEEEEDEEELPVLYYHTKDQNEYQGDRFKDRTSLFLNQSTGEASLQLREVQPQDQGTYRCSTEGTGGTNSLFINLEVDGMRHFSITQKITDLCFDHSCHLTKKKRCRCQSYEQIN